MDLNLNRNDINEIISSIKERKILPCCVIYEFLAHQKLLKQCFKNKLEECPQTPESMFSKNRLSQLQQKRISKIYKVWKNPLSKVRRNTEK